MLESIFSAQATVWQMVIMMVVAVVLGLLTCLIFSYKNELSKSMKLTMVLLPAVVAVVIFMVNGNIGAGVAVAGAFALIRFRSAPGSAREISAIFTEMAMGIALGMGYVFVGVLLFAVTAVVVIVLTCTGFGSRGETEKQLKISIPEDLNYDGLFDEVFNRFGIRASLQKIKTTKMGTIFELTYKTVFPGGKVPKEFLDELRVRNGNLTVSVSTLPEKEGL